MRANPQLATYELSRYDILLDYYLSSPTKTRLGCLMTDLLKAYFLAKSIDKRLDDYIFGAQTQSLADRPLTHSFFPNDLLDAFAFDRQNICELVRSLSSDDQEDLAKVDEIHSVSGRLKGMFYDRPPSEREKEFLNEQKEIFYQNWDHPEAFKAFVILAYYYQPFEFPLQNNIAKLSASQLVRYIYFVMRQPHLMIEAHEKTYLSYYKEVVPWLDLLIREKPELKGLIASNLTFGACYYIDLSTKDLVRARSKIVDTIVDLTPDFDKLRPFPKGAGQPSPHKKIRIGILSRNLGDYTDTRALFAMFRDFDRDRYEFYWYSMEVMDQSTLMNVEFFRDIYGFIHKATAMAGCYNKPPKQNAAVMAQQILDDDLDILVVGSALSFGAKEMDQMLSQHLARVQIGMNAMVPGSSGFDSYDYFIVPEADDECMGNFLDESTETLKTLPDPLIWYEKRSPTPPDASISRQALGVPEDAILYCSIAVANKQFPGTIRTWLNILQRVPNSYLLFCPFNPAWGGYFIAQTFFARLRRVLADFPEIDPSRIVVCRELTPSDTNRMIALSDVYLGSFPHGGSTSAMLALVHNKPLIARRSPWLRGTTDASFLKSIGLHELIGKDNADYADIGVRLGLDEAYRKEIVRKTTAKMADPPFFRVKERSQGLQKLFDEICHESGLCPDIKYVPRNRASK